MAIGDITDLTFTSQISGGNPTPTLNFSVGMSPLFSNATSIQLLYWPIWSVNGQTQYGSQNWITLTRPSGNVPFTAIVPLSPYAVSGSTTAITLTGNALANTITGGTGNDTLNGGLGNDTYLIDNLGDTATETSTLLTEIDTVQSSISHILGLNIENLTFTGSGNIDGTGNLLDNILTGNSGSNILDGGAGVDMLYGGAGADTLIYDSADSKIDGGAGIDILKISGSGIALDLSQLIAGKIAGIEKLDLTGSGNNSLSVNMASLLNLTGPAGHNLYVTGDAGDSVTVETLTGAMWKDVVALTNVGGVNYHHTPMPQQA